MKNYEEIELLLSQTIRQVDNLREELQIYKEDNSNSKIAFNSLKNNFLITLESLFFYDLPENLKEILIKKITELKE